MPGRSQTASRTLALWLSVAVAAHLAAMSTITALYSMIHMPDVVAPYVLVFAYAIPAAIGLGRADQLSPGKAVAFALLIAAAHAIAFTATFYLLMGSGEGFTSGNPLWAGGIGGAIGALVSLIGLGVLGARWDERTTVLVVGFSGLLALLGGGLTAVFAQGLKYPFTSGLSEAWLYLIWQVPFSVAIFLMAQAGADPFLTSPKAPS